jgi:alpha-dioxygenase
MAMPERCTRVQVAITALRSVYGDDIEACDLLVGVLAEEKIPGFAISTTAFHIFLLMASRRLEADRFLTEDFNEATYGRVGFEWVRKTSGLRDVLRRHYPELEAALPKGASAFTPYRTTPAGA